jgi:pimeloyl-ACP methyl ester carboxylesterase
MGLIRRASREPKRTHPKETHQMPETMTTTASAVRWAPATATRRLDVPGVGVVDIRVRDRDRVQPFLLLHGGAGPASVAGFGDLLAARKHARVITPIHPGFDGTPRPDTLASIAGLAGLYAALLDELDVWDVTVIGNSIGGWIAAELALLGSPRVSGAILVNAVGIAVEGHPVTDIAGLSPQEVMALSFHDPGRFAPDSDTPGPTPDMVQANMAALAAYGGRSMTDPTLLGRLGDLDLPVQVIWGEADRIVIPDYGRAYAKAMPMASFTLMPRAGHLPQVEAPEELLGLIWDLGQDQPPR